MVKKVPARDDSKHAEAVAAAGQEVVDTVAKAGQEAREGLKKAAAATRKSAEEASTTAFRGYDEFLHYGQDGLDAYAESGAAVVKGVQSFNLAILECAQSMLDTQLSATQALFAATTMKEMVDQQIDLVQKTWDHLLTESGRLTEISAVTASEAIAPLQAHINDGIERATKLRAA